MISRSDRAKIEDIARRYRVARILLFGSSSEEGTEGKDIDLAVEGLAPELFFAFYAELIFGLSKPVDLVDLGRASRFTDIIRREGVALYG
jgi:predicted nucleotidyltransferase